MEILPRLKTGGPAELGSTQPRLSVLGFALPELAAAVVSFDC